MDVNYVEVLFCNKVGERSYVTCVISNVGGTVEVKTAMDIDAFLPGLVRQVALVGIRCLWTGECGVPAFLVELTAQVCQRL
jgi:hypothetical protein